MVAYVTVLGVIGAKLWHVLEDPVMLMHYPAATLFDRAGFAWYGGRCRGHTDADVAGTRGEGRARCGMLDLAAPAAAVGYGVGRIGCLTSGDGDYGIATNAALGHELSARPGADVQRVHPTPVYELIARAAHRGDFVEAWAGAIRAR